MQTFLSTTHYKARTLSPKWNEEFILDVNRIDDDALRIDVWDFNWDENVTDKFRKINEIKVLHLIIDKVVLRGPKKTRLEGAIFLVS